MEHHINEVSRSVIKGKGSGFSGRTKFYIFISCFVVEIVTVLWFSKKPLHSKNVDCVMEGIKNTKNVVTIVTIQDPSDI